MSQTPPPHARPLFHIRYREDFGNVVRRDIFPIRPYATTEGVRAWCYLMGEMRLFKFDQIEAVKEINTGRDIKARGLWEWCGLPTTDMAFSDELPGALKQSPWVEAPDSPRFRVQFLRRGKACTLDVAPSRWESHRAAFGGLAWPAKSRIEIEWAAFLQITDLQTGEVLDRCDFWRRVLEHRSDEALPWYVQWADQRPVVDSLIAGTRVLIGQFRATHFPTVNGALESLKMSPVDDSGMRAIAKGSNNGDWIRPLTPIERAACRVAIRKICEAHKKDPGEELLRRFPLT
ncbi:hypothetical protein [Comamonas flocculans]|uniref:Uncharacterized protein n=1 Tax=Comamonas flocculans TaxID=2597701 RepID=A0A5B8RTB3_9BURK|nr:hypothetical protein [Comamonas flocculans]QEA11964.1 hypothetical protein FOZ74_02325 [Comamonas flocculans]